MKKTKEEEIKYKYYHWGPFLFQSQITSAECELILNEGKRCRKKSNDFRHELAGHLSEEYKLSGNNKIAEGLKKYFHAYAIAYNTWRGDKGTMESKFQLTALWINYMKAGDFNPPHEHAGDLSFVVYPEVPDELRQENKAFKGTMGGPGGISWRYGEGNRQCVNTVNLLPTTGDIFIFPACLQHWVFPFRSKVERISVSGNVLFGKDSRTNYVGESKKEEDINLSVGGGGGSNFDHSDRS